MAGNSNDEFDLMEAVLGDARDRLSDKGKALMHAIEMIMRNCDRFLHPLAYEEFVDIFNSSVGAAIDKGKPYDEYAETYLRMRWAMVGAYANRKAIQKGETMISAETLRLGMDKVVAEARCVKDGCTRFQPRWIFCDDYKPVHDGDLTQ